jgi:large subunit ribosomal protein L10
VNLSEKNEIVENVRERFLASSFVALTIYQGTTVKQFDALRRACEAKGMHYQVVKNTLSKRAIAGTPYEKLADHFKGTIGVFFGNEDPSASAKLLKDQVKSNEKLALKAGFFDGDVLDADATLAIADLPSKEQLLSSLLATIQESPRQVLGVIQGPARDLLYLLNNYANKLEEQGG